MSDFDYVVVRALHQNFVRSQKTKFNLERARSVPFSIDIEERGNLWLYFSSDQREKLKAESRLTYEDHGTAEVDLYRVSVVLGLSPLLSFFLNLYHECCKSKLLCVVSYRITTTLSG
jgi:hypothetical protein